MGASTNQGPVRPQLWCGIVLRAAEDTCEILGEGRACSVRYAKPFPSPRAGRVSPGHLVAVAAVPNGTDVVLWRWYDAVVLGQEDGLVRLWEPGHGEVLAKPRRPQQVPLAGTRAYLSAGLPGAEWWVAGAVAVRARDADVELDEVERLYDEFGLWNDL
jgi:hypothetical protein